jgi:outer membrane protein OmpA-like peptidoglycan-associated protein
MQERVFYLWQVRTFTVRLALDFVEVLGQNLKSLKQAEEHGGLLLGRVIDNDTVEVTDFEFIRSKHHRGASYDLGGGERYSVERYVKNFSKRSGPKPVGYFRTHLRPGLFLDQSDFALMTESFSDLPGIALAICTDQTDPANAGIFFWEDGDIDRSRTELIFPFDAATLRVQGPVEQEIQAPTITGNAWAWASELKKSSPSLLWGTAAAILGFAMVPVFHLGIGPESNTPAQAPFARPLPAASQPEWPAVSNSAPATLKDVPKIRISEPQAVSPPIFSQPIGDADTASIGDKAEQASDQHAEADAEAARERSAQGEADAQATRVQPRTTVELPRPDTQQSELRMGLLEQLKAVISVRDTPRGLVATVPDSAFDGSELHAAVSGQLARLAAIMQAHPGLRADVDGNADTSAGEEMSSRRAEAVRRALIAQGLPDSSVTAHGLGDTRLFGPNSTAEGRAANRRVEVVISGDPIGDLPLWDHTHALRPEN